MYVVRCPTAGGLQVNGDAEMSSASRIEFREAEGYCSLRQVAKPPKFSWLLLGSTASNSDKQACLWDHLS